MYRDIKIDGTIKRNCSRCGKMTECKCFEVEGKSKIMCEDCMSIVYDYGKETKHGYVRCDNCHEMRMKRDMTKDEITDTHIIHHYTCEHCARQVTDKIIRWKQ